MVAIFMRYRNWRAIQASLFESCKLIKGNPDTQNIPVILLTAIHEVNKKVKGLDVGADDFITKPFDESELFARVRAFIRTKKLLDELKEAYSSLKDLEQMRDSLVHMVVHDLKNPLTAVQGVFTILGDVIHNKEKYTEDHANLLNNGKRSCKLILDQIQGMLDISRMEKNKMPIEKSKIKIRDLVKECVDMFSSSSTKKGVSLEWETVGLVPEICIDRNLIFRVITNIITNSLKFTDSGGTIGIKINAEPTKKQIQVVISDTGIGIPSENVGKIFDKYFQVVQNDSSRQGHGLGLAFCKLAIEKHGGKIWAESVQGKGTSFTILLPIE